MSKLRPFEFPTLGFLHARSCRWQGADGRAHAARAGRSCVDVAGIALTEKRGAVCVPIAADAARFWITRLHGLEANYSDALPCLDAAARKLNEGDEAGAQTRLMRAG